jgi:hypothetical protein
MFRKLLLVLALVFAAFAATLVAASILLEPESVGPVEAPDPATTSEAVVRVYGADVWGVRGRFAIHTWIVTKVEGEAEYRKYQVIGWRARRGQPVVSITRGEPDAPWFSAQPVLLKHVQGHAATRLIDQIHQAALDYPYSREYVMWPGPNSNSFIAWIGLKVPGLDLDLPTKAIGKDWMIENFEATAL